MFLSERNACSRILAIATALLGGSAAAEAANPLYWPGHDFGYDRPLYDAPVQQPRRRLVHQPRMPKAEAEKAEKLARSVTKPTGPLVIAISIEHQTMKVYDSNGFFAETPISSGVMGHSTPMGVFSVIQKNKWHRSNLYSDAPMPFMQRLTWSGIALHAGVVPGHPASHGCVRMPMTFAVKMWAWTRMGARVVITPGEISPASFAHPLLASLKPAADAAPVATTPIPAAALPDVKTSEGLPVITTKTADASNSFAAAVSDVTATTVSVADIKGTIPAAVTQAAPAAKRGSPIAMFVSRKDSKLYVRQNFAPLFDVPLTISGDQPLGTHVLTAYADKDAAKPMLWTALTLPASARMDEQALSRHRHAASAVVTPPPVIQASATEALDRLKLPDEVLTRLGDQISAGSSLVISDQGMAASGETGAGTDFIIGLR